MLRAAIENVNCCEGLPSVILHGDCHLENIFKDKEKKLPIFIDWDGGGLGPALIDLGLLVSSCHPTESDTALDRPNARRTEAIIKGYCSTRKICSSEFEKLDDAIRFRALVALVYFFEIAVKQRKLGSKEQAKQKWCQARFSSATETADICLELLRQYG